MAISLKDMMFLICSRVLIFLVLLKKPESPKEDRDQFITNMRLANLDAELNIPTDEWIEHHWFENTGDIFTCIKADSHNIGD